MKGRTFLFFVVCLIQLGCTPASETPEPKGIGLKGQWIVDQNQQVMLNPQTSGLVAWRGRLLTVADGSADVSQRLRLSQIQTNKALLHPKAMKMVMTDAVKNSCFAAYLADEPDFEALVVDPQNDREFIVVTEDARESTQLSDACAKRFENTGSTEYPTLLVRLVLNEKDQVEMRNVRPVQFAAEFAVGNYPNDGIEGMAFAPDRTLYLALEKDNDAQPRIFSTHVDEDFWQTDGFIAVDDPQLATPRFASGNHPINGMDYYATQDGGEFLIAAARNDEELWIIDISKQRETKRIALHFLAPVSGDYPECEPWELMDNASLEGVAVLDQTLWLVNDPWKRNYHKNIQCEANRDSYEKMAPLIFNLPIDPSWFGASAG